jgi:hypothetical protein
MRVSLSKNSSVCFLLFTNIAVRIRKNSYELFFWHGNNKGFINLKFSFSPVRLKNVDNTSVM